MSNLNSSNTSEAVSSNAEEQPIITDQITITRARFADGTLAIGAEFSDDLGAADALGMLEFAKIDVFTAAMSEDED